MFLTKKASCLRTRRLLSVMAVYFTETMESKIYLHKSSISKVLEKKTLLGQFSTCYELFHRLQR